MDSLDPNQGDDPDEIAIGHQCMRGLVTYDPVTAEVRPAVADRWDTPDGRTWTFHLRGDVTFDGGEPVDAGAFVRGWSNATWKAAASPVAYLFSEIEGFATQQSGKTKLLSGVQAIDTSTLRVTLIAPDAEFVVRTGHVAFSPRPTDATVASRMPSYSQNPTCDGPFEFKEPWKHNESVTLVRNPDYYGPPPYLSTLVYRIFPSLDAAYAEWQAGRLDWTRVPASKFREARSRYGKRSLLKTTAKLNYLVMSVVGGATANVDFRRAISLAIDRAAISQMAFAGLNKPATGILPPVVRGYRAPEADGVGACSWCVLDLTRARSELEKARQAGVDVTATIQLSFESGAGHEVWMQAVSSELEQNLGLSSRLKPFDSTRALSAFLTGKDANGLARGALGMDYPSPDDFLFPLFDSASGDNRSRYKNPRFDSLIVRARTTLDATPRTGLYRQAEDIALSDLPVIPMWWGAQFRLASLDKFGGLQMNVFEEPTVETAYVSS